MKPLMSLSLPQACFFILEAGQIQAMRDFGVQPNTWWSSQETKETPLSAKMSEKPGLGMENGGCDPGVAILLMWGLKVGKG